MDDALSDLAGPDVLDRSQDQGTVFLARRQGLLQGFQAGQGFAEVLASGRARRNPGSRACDVAVGLLDVLVGKQQV
jgi:hypothetical protein